MNKEFIIDTLLKYYGDLNEAYSSCQNVEIWIHDPKMFSIFVNMLSSKFVEDTLLYEKCLRTLILIIEKILNFFDFEECEIMKLVEVLGKLLSENHEANTKISVCNLISNFEFFESFKSYFDEKMINVDINIKLYFYSVNFLIDDNLIFIDLYESAKYQINSDVEEERKIAFDFFSSAIQMLDPDFIHKMTDLREFLLQNLMNISKIEKNEMSCYFLDLILLLLDPKFDLFNNDILNNILYCTMEILYNPQINISNKIKIHSILEALSEFYPEYMEETILSFNNLLELLLSLSFEIIQKRNDDYFFNFNFLNFYIKLLNPKDVVNSIMRFMSNDNELFLEKILFYCYLCEIIVTNIHVDFFYEYENEIIKILILGIQEINDGFQYPQIMDLFNALNENTPFLLIAHYESLYKCFCNDSNICKLYYLEKLVNKVRKIPSDFNISNIHYYFYQEKDYIFILRIIILIYSFSDNINEEIYKLLIEPYDKILFSEINLEFLDMIQILLKICPKTISNKFSLIFKMIYNYIEEEIYYNDEYKRNIIENICILFINIMKSNVIINNEQIDFIVYFTQYFDKIFSSDKEEEENIRKKIDTLFGYFYIYLEENDWKSKVINILESNIENETPNLEFLNVIISKLTDYNQYANKYTIDIESIKIIMEFYGIENLNILEALLENIETKDGIDCLISYLTFDFSDELINSIYIIIRKLLAIHNNSIINKPTLVLLLTLIYCQFHSDNILKEILELFHNIEIHIYSLGYIFRSLIYLYQRNIYLFKAIINQEIVKYSEEIIQNNTKYSNSLVNESIAFYICFSNCCSESLNLFSKLSYINEDNEFLVSLSYFINNDIEISEPIIRFCFYCLSSNEFFWKRIKNKENVINIVKQNFDEYIQKYSTPYHRTLIIINRINK